jgi:hypothetical protein
LEREDIRETGIVLSILASRYAVEIDRCLDAEFVGPMDSTNQIRVCAGNVGFEVENVDDVPVSDGL